MHSLERRLSKLELSEAAGRFFVAKAREECGADRVFAEAGAGSRDTTAIPEKQWGQVCGELMAREEIELEINVQHRILASSNRARLAAEYEEVRLEALAAGDLVLAASCIAAKAMLAVMRLPERIRW